MAGYGEYGGPPSRGVMAYEAVVSHQNRETLHA